METVETVYPNFEAASKAKAVGEGKWIPGFLPLSATNIREKHNLDTNEVWLFFHFSTDDLASIINACQQTAQHEVIYPRKSVGNWWPQALTQYSKKIQPSDKTYEYYHCNDGGTMAIRGNEVFYWHSGDGRKK